MEVGEFRGLMDVESGRSFLGNTNTLDRGLEKEIQETYRQYLSVRDTGVNLQNYAAFSVSTTSTRGSMF